MGMEGGANSPFQEAVKLHFTLAFWEGVLPGQTETTVFSQLGAVGTYIFSRDMSRENQTGYPWQFLLLHHFDAGYMLRKE